MRSRLGRLVAPVARGDERDAMLFEKTWGETNKRVVKTFGQSRQTMPLPMLQKVMVWLEEMYPLRTASRK